MACRLHNPAPMNLVHFDEYEGDEVTSKWRPQQGARVLIVDDDPAMRQLLAESLAREGYEVHQADSGDGLLTMIEALADDIAPGKPVDLILTDVRMPGLSGIEAIRRLAGSVDVPTILMTAFPDAELEGTVRRLGVPLLCKPFTLEEVSRVALSALLGAQGR